MTAKNLVKPLLHMLATNVARFHIKYMQNYSWYSSYCSQIAGLIQMIHTSS